MIAISYELDFRPVLKSNGKSLMGFGRARLLKQIKETRSLSTAAKRRGMSYRHAWGIINRMEEISGEKIVKSERGGSERGQSDLTAAGEKLLSEFESKYSALERAYEEAFRRPGLTTDGILVVADKVLLVRRKREPFKGQYALPGGFVEYGERVEECVVREFQEETGIRVSIDRLIGVYSEPERDPRGHTITLAYSLNTQGGALKDSEETHAEWVQLGDLPRLAFDHDAIVADYLKSIKKRRKVPE